VKSTSRVASALASKRLDWAVALSELQRVSSVKSLALALKEESMSYVRFGLMIATATIVMYGLMYLNTYALDHVWFSQTRVWMAILMGAVMAIIMLSFKLNMYKNNRINIAIIVAAIALFVAALWLVRSQETVFDVAYMKAMIPHHSIAILTSRRAHIRDPRVRKLADQIIESQVREIEEMKQLIANLEQNPVAANTPDLAPRAAKGLSPN
jgi:hypothetical protein